MEFDSRVTLDLVANTKHNDIHPMQLTLLGNSLLFLIGGMI